MDQQSCPKIRMGIVLILGQLWWKVLIHLKCWLLYILLYNSISIVVLLKEVSSPLKWSCVLPSDPESLESLRDRRDLSSEHCEHWMNIAQYTRTGLPQHQTHSHTLQTHSNIQMCWSTFLFLDLKQFLTSLLHHSHTSAIMHLALNSTWNDLSNAVFLSCLWRISCWNVGGAKSCFL